MAGIPRGRSVPCPLGMYCRRTNVARYRSVWTRSATSSTCSRRCFPYSQALIRSTPGAARLFSHRQHPRRKTTLRSPNRLRNRCVL